MSSRSSKEEDIRDVESTTFGHAMNGSSDAQESKRQVIDIAKIQGVTAIFLTFFGFMLVGEVAVDRRDSYYLDKKCAGIPYAGLLFLYVAWSIGFVIFVAYKRAVWDRIGWDEHDSLLGCTVLMIVDIAMTVWLFSGCVCNANEAVFFILAFIAVIVKTLASIVHMYHFDIFRHLTQGLQPIESFSRDVIQSPYARTATRDSPDSSPSNDAKIRRGSFQKNNNLSRTPTKRQELPTVTPVYSTPPSQSSSSMLEPDMFTRLWESLPDAGSFERDLQRLASEKDVLTHLKAQGFSIAAHGTVKNCAKFYFYCGSNKRRFLCEIKIWQSGRTLSVTFKCEDPSRAKDYIQMLCLADVFGE